MLFLRTQTPHFPVSFAIRWQAGALDPSSLAPIKSWLGDFPGSPVVKNPSYNTGDAGSIPGQGTKSPHATGQLSPHATTTELVHLN